MYFSSDFYMFPAYRGQMQYRCLDCDTKYPTDELLYTCPKCQGVFLLEDTTFEALNEIAPQDWRDLFDARAATKRPELRGIFRFYELMAPMLEEEDIVCLGEGNTPVIPANAHLQSLVGQPLAFKHDGLNPSASFKDRGMACAFSLLKHLVRTQNWDEVLTICASTGDTSAAAAMYAAYVGDPLKSVVLLPQGKVTAQQLAQPLGSGAIVLEVPGVFDDCMKVVEYLAERYRVALMNSKNAWRILGQESYAFEVAQWRDWQTQKLAVFVPIGNAGNITAVMAGFLKLHALDIIEHLPRIVGVQSVHADPVFKYYAQDANSREYAPVNVKPSVAQAAMIGNPVSFPRVKYMQERYEAIAGSGSFQVVQVNEQAIIEGMLRANRHGHVACTQGGECLAGLLEAKSKGLLDKDELAILDATAHSLKFIDFQQKYFEDDFDMEYTIFPRKALQNKPTLVVDPSLKDSLSPESFTEEAALAVADKLELKAKQ